MKQDPRHYIRRIVHAVARAGVNDASVPQYCSTSLNRTTLSTGTILGLRAKASRSLIDVEDSGKFDRRARRREL